MRIGLVGCVKSKINRSAAAKDLYTSALFRGARRQVEKTCDAWYILSAQHGLVAPEMVLAPYDRTLSSASTSERRRWAQRVLNQIDHALGHISGLEFEVHAGSSYLNFGLTEGLRARGATVLDPLRGLALGHRLAFYKRRAR